ncbi:hypothetical protein CHARACLAT_027895 [Characodon lateralis]|uniref:Uncharacterized protein n=1 Tax=Characodon lateralis TaxID=208331 RepID=A0ABU7DAN0_9TELE|nr:hypothetical protein [Characodon lateralis]
MPDVHYRVREEIKYCLLLWKSFLIIAEGSRDTDTAVSTINRSRKTVFIFSPRLYQRGQFREETQINHPDESCRTGNESSHTPTRSRKTESHLKESDLLTNIYGFKVSVSLTLS